MCSLLFSSERDIKCISDVLVSMNPDQPVEYLIHPHLPIVIDQILRAITNA